MLHLDYYVQLHIIHFVHTNSFKYCHTSHFGSKRFYGGLHFLSFLGSPRKLNFKIKRFIKWTDFNFLISQTKKFFNIKLKEFERFIKKKKKQNITIYIIMCMCSFSKLWLKSSFQDVKKNVKMIKTKLLLLHSIISIYVQEHFYSCGGLLHV